MTAALIQRLIEACKAIDAQFQYESFEAMDQDLGIAWDTEALADLWRCLEELGTARLDVERSLQP